ncbi:MAG TPA: glycosyltransferase family 4 protein, partial [Anaerovoracaceae bacterium]|nr:glycosyltransferase family 4 protein [Anaerovoracaceae bacterium]
TKKKILDIPNERSSHLLPTPSGGGAAIVIAWYIGISILFFYGEVNRDLYFALLSGILLATISLIDDVFNIKPLIRLIVQTITVVISFILLKGIQPVFSIGTIFNIILYPVTIIGIIWFINLFNFLDGIDGYASVEAISLGFALFFFTGNSISLVLIASVAGFLIWNWPNAKIFMGDVGSTQLGFIIAVLGIYFHNEHKFQIINLLILSAPFWFDATLTLYRRWRNKEHLSQAHRKHIYQRLVQSGFSHLKIDIFLSLLNLVLIFLVFICVKFTFLQIPLLILTVSSLYLISVYTDKRKAF